MRSCDKDKTATMWTFTERKSGPDTSSLNTKALCCVFNGSIFIHHWRKTSTKISDVRWAVIHFVMLLLQTPDRGGFISHRNHHFAQHNNLWTDALLNNLYTPIHWISPTMSIQPLWQMCTLCKCCVTLRFTNTVPHSSASNTLHLWWGGKKCILPDVFSSWHEILYISQTVK